MGIGVALLILGLVIYFGMSAVGASIGGPNPRPGTGDVPAWISGVALLGGLVAVIGVVITVGGLTGVIGDSTSSSPRPTTTTSVMVAAADDSPPGTTSAAAPTTASTTRTSTTSAQTTAAEGPVPGSRGFSKCIGLDDAARYDCVLDELGPVVQDLFPGAPRDSLYEYAMGWCDAFDDIGVSTWFMRTIEDIHAGGDPEWVVSSWEFINFAAAYAYCPEYLPDVATWMGMERCYTPHALCYLVDDATGEAEWIAILASLPTGQYASTDAQDELETYVTTTGLDLQLLLSDDYGSLNPGYWVIYASDGWTDDESAAAYCNSVRDTYSLASTCYPRLLND